MGAYNWIFVDATCPACGRAGVLRCQTHVASDHAGDTMGRFHDREYRIGEPMAWWPADHPRWSEWYVGGRQDVHGDGWDEEACYADCPHCRAALFAVIRFRGNVPERVLSMGKESEWPAGYLK